MDNGLLIAIILIFGWILVLLGISPWIRKTKRLSLIGPLLMIKAIRKRGILDKIADHFPAVGFSRFSVALILATGVFAIFFLFYGAYLSTLVTTRVSEPLSYYIGLPGLNPIIPVTYGIPAFGISIIIHEMFHGIVARKHGMKVNSVGVLFFVVPIGAFVEPDEEEMTRSDAVIRRRVYASGAGVNMVIGLAMILLLAFVMMPAAQPVHDGVYVQSVPASQSSIIQPGQEITGYANYSGAALGSMLVNSQIAPGQLEPLQIFNGTGTHTVKYPSGVSIASTLSGFPASKANMKAGEIVYKVNNNLIYNETQMISVIENVTPGSTVGVEAMNFTLVSGTWHKTVDYYNFTTVTKYSYYAQYDPGANKQEYKNQSFIGITSSYLGIEAIPLGTLKPVIFLHTVFTDPWYGFISSISLPLTGLSPVPHSLAQLYHTPFNSLIFWGTMNTVYWLYWVNVLLAITNALPLLILDGNQFFKDSFYIAGRRKRFSFLQKDTVLNRIMSVLNVVVIFLFLWEIIVPRII